MASANRASWIARGAWPRGLLRRLLRSQGGSVAVYVGLTLPIFVGAAGLAVDVSSWYRAKRTIQTGVDAAAYAAALDLARQGLAGAPDMAEIKAAANDAASRNGLTSPVLVERNSQTVEVIATKRTPLYFSALFLDAEPQISARAVARAVVSDACVWSLHPSERGAVTVGGNADLSLGCGIVVNSDHTEALRQHGNSCVQATSISVRGNYSGSCVTPEPEVLTPDYGDPLSDLEPPFVGTCDHANKVKPKSKGNSAAFLDPGVYCGGIHINSDVAFRPGLYIINGGELRVTGNATVTNEENASGGVTFFLTGSGGDYATATIASNAEVTLTPMSTGPLANVLFFQDRDAPAGGDNKFVGGSTLRLTGILYFPNQLVRFAGGSSGEGANVLLVASLLSFKGGAHLIADNADSLLPEAYHVRLVE